MYNAIIADFLANDCKLPPISNPDSVFAFWRPVLPAWFHGCDPFDSSFFEGGTTVEQKAGVEHGVDNYAIWLCIFDKMKQPTNITVKPFVLFSWKRNISPFPHW